MKFKLLSLFPFSVQAGVESKIEVRLQSATATLGKSYFKIVHIHTGLLAVSFYVMVGETLSLKFEKVMFLNKFCGDLADHPGSAVVQKGCLKNRGSGFNTRWSFLFL